jgi:hypothetical protein
MRNHTSSPSYSAISPMHAEGRGTQSSKQKKCNLRSGLAMPEFLQLSNSLIPGRLSRTLTTAGSVKPNRSSTEM